MARRRVAARAVHLFEDDACFRDAEARAAVLLGDERRKIAGFGERANERVRIRAAGVELAPVRVTERRAQLAHRIAQHALVLREVQAGRNVVGDHPALMLLAPR